jgi:hypothetical protein
MGPDKDGIPADGDRITEFVTDVRRVSINLDLLRKAACHRSNPKNEAHEEKL